MSDLVERLRADEWTGTIAEEAADEIERLRAALHNIAIGGNGERNWSLSEVRAVAWDAIGDHPNAIVQA